LFSAGCAIQINLSRRKGGIYFQNSESKGVTALAFRHFAEFADFSPVAICYGLAMICHESVASGQRGTPPIPIEQAVFPGMDSSSMTKSAK
jgi:hypothetical protein